MHVCIAMNPRENWRRVGEGGGRLRGRGGGQIVILTDLVPPSESWCGSYDWRRIAVCKWDLKPLCSYQYCETYILHTHINKSRK